jgi:hypothetical protein
VSPPGSSSRTQRSGDAGPRGLGVWPRFANPLTRPRPLGPG